MNLSKVTDLADTSTMAADSSNDDDVISLDDDHLHQETRQLESLQRGQEQEAEQSSTSDDNGASDGVENPESSEENNGESSASGNPAPLEDTSTSRASLNRHDIIEILDDENDDEVIVLDGPQRNAPQATQTSRNVDQPRASREKDNNSEYQKKRAQKYKRLALGFQGTLKSQRQLHSEAIQQKERALKQRMEQFQARLERQSKQDVERVEREFEEQRQELEVELQGVRLDRQTLLREKKEVTRELAQLEKQLVSMQTSLKTCQEQASRNQRKQLEQLKKVQEDYSRVCSKNVDLKKQVSQYAFLVQQHQSKNNPESSSQTKDTINIHGRSKRPASNGRAGGHPQSTNNTSQAIRSTTSKDLFVENLLSLHSEQQQKKPKTKTMLKELGSIVAQTQQDPAPPLAIYGSSSSVRADRSLVSRCPNTLVLSRVPNRVPKQHQQPTSSSENQKKRAPSWAYDF